MLATTTIRAFFVASLIQLYSTDAFVVGPIGRPVGCTTLLAESEEKRSLDISRGPSGAYSKGGEESVGFADITQMLVEMGTQFTVQGGAVRTWPFDNTVASVQVLLKTQGRPLNARIELMQGPNNDKVVMDVYSEDGNKRPYFTVIESPGSENVVRIINTATLEFPMTAIVEPFHIDERRGGGGGGENFVMGGGAF
jgi:hypothetical protein